MKITKTILLLVALLSTLCINAQTESSNKSPGPAAPSAAGAAPTAAATHSTTTAAAATHPAQPATAVGTQTKPNGNVKPLNTVSNTNNKTNLNNSTARPQERKAAAPVK